MNNIELKNKLLDIVNNYETVYMYGCWGQVVNEPIINSKAKQYPWWYTAVKQRQLKGLVGKKCFAFDCVCLIKSILWGWNGSTTKGNGGAVYGSNGVPDISANTMITKCTNVSTDFSTIEVGEAVWLKGHIGVYIGDGQVVECTPAWKNKVQITKLSQRNWLKHGKLPYIVYKNTTTETVKGTITITGGSWNVRKGPSTTYPVTRVVKSGDVLKHYGIINGWYKLENGYISSKAVKSINASTKTKTTTGNVYLRSTADYGNNVICVIPKGAKVTYYSGTGWAKVNYNGKTGYCGYRFLK